MKKLYPSLVLLFATLFSYGQNVPADSTKKPPPDSIKLVQNIVAEQYKKYLPNPTPLSPNAASFQKFGDYPVNLSTGLPDISIPLYTVTEGELSVPIVLRCHPGGHRISEQASWVGWGFSLTVGGSVNSRMQGIPDDAGGSDYLNKPIQNTLDLCNNSVDYGYASNIRGGIADGEPDINSFSYPGGGGRFLNGQGTDAPFMIPSQPIKVEKKVTGGKIRGFDIFGPNGVMYEFGANTGSRETQSQTAGSASSNFHVSTWHLDSIKSAVTDDKIAFSYQNGGSITQNSRQWSASIISNASPNNGNPYQNSVSVQATPTNVTFVNNQLHPHRITYANGEVEFVQSTSSEVRADMPTSNYLKHINIYTYEGGVKTLQKVIKFTYSYFDDVDGNQARLKLDKLTIKDVNETESATYSMDYWTDSFSWKDDLDVYNNQDYFGFFNGANNQSLISLSSYNTGSNMATISNGGADRSSVATYLKEGILKTLTYPTKGYTLFDYEANRYKVGGTEYVAGGLRLKEMVQYPLTGEPMLKRYEYGSALGTGIGELPTTWTPQTANLARIQQLDFRGSGTAAPIASATQHIITPNGQVDMGSFDSNPVYYTQVSEYFESDTAALTNGRNDYVFSRQQDIVVSVAPPFQRDIRPWKRGQLLSKKTYDRANNLVSEQANTYTATDITKTAAVHIDSRNVYEGGGHAPACATGYLGSGTNAEMLYSTYEYRSGSSLPTSTTSMLDGVSTTRTTAYNTNLFPVSTTEERSSGYLKVMGYVYPDTVSYSTVSYAQELLNRHMLNTVLETNQYETEDANTVQTFQHKRVFGTFSGDNAQGFTDNLLPKEEWVAPTGTVLEKRVEFTDYDTDGNVLSYTVDGVPTSLLWGYNNQLVVGMVQNADRSAVTTALASSGLDQTAFAADSLTTAQRTAIADFQDDIPTSLSTWYAYRPHIGMTLQIAPNGLKTHYAYDGLWRLKSVRDNQENVTDLYAYKYAGESLQTGNLLNIPPENNAIVHSQFRQATTDRSKYSDPNYAITTIQYLDPLGRPIQKVGFRHGNGGYGQDIIYEDITYDLYGRPVKTTLPAPSALGTSGYNGSYKPDAQIASNFFYQDLNAFSETTEFDNSPLNRPKVSYGPGKEWRDSLRNVQTFYGAENGLVRYYDRSANGSINLIGYYPTNSLFRGTTVDEQRDTVINITDTQGRLIQNIIKHPDGNLITYYLYDALNRPLAVIQPEGSGINSFAYNGADYQKYVFAYEYDDRGRVSRKHVPGGGWTNFVYDKRDQVVLVQSPLQEETDLWSFSKYDVLGRVAITGELESTQSQADLKTAFNTVAVPFETRNVNSYNGVSFPAAIVTGAYTERQFFYYDNYDWIKPEWAFTDDFPQTAAQEAPKGNPTGAWSNNPIAGSGVLHQIMYYDNKNRLISTEEIQPDLLNNDQDSTLLLFNRYSFSGQLLAKKENYKLGRNIICPSYNRLDFMENPFTNTSYLTDFGSGGFPVNATLSYYHKDDLNRPKQTIVGLPTAFYYFPPFPVSDYLSLPPNPFSTKIDIAKRAIIFNPGTLIEPQNTGTYAAYIDPAATNGVSGIQYMDYTYHIRGGLLGINLDGNKNPVPNATENDLFAYKLGYETAGQWDGNIGKQTWAGVSSSGAAAAAVENRSYTYTYDPAKRLKTAAYTGVGSEDFSIPNMSYDKNGNITNLQRNGKNGSSFGAIDNLNYIYSGNRLTNITDASGSPEGFKQATFGGPGASYTYYSDGSLKSDANEGIQNIVYDTFLKQPKEVYLTDGRKYYNYYDGSGRLLKTVYYAATGAILETFAYSGVLVVKNDTVSQMQTLHGRAVLNYVGSNAVRWDFEYDYKDHLGNTRVSFRDVGNQATKTAETAFDPWGLKLTGVGSVNEFQNRWELQGKEQDLTFGLNRVNFGARVYNPTIGRWDRVDNFSEAAPNLTGYRYSFNNPVNVIDPDGNFEYEKPVFEYSDGYGIYSSSGSTGMISFSGTYSTGRAEPEGQGTPQQGDNNDCTCGCSGKPPCETDKEARRNRGNEAKSKGFWDFMNFAYSLDGLAYFIDTIYDIDGGSGTLDKDANPIQKVNDMVYTMAVGKLFVIVGKGASAVKKEIRIPKGFRDTGKFIKIGAAKAPILTDGKRFISPDLTQHKTPGWKMAKTIKGLGSNKTRTGTYDELFNKVGK